MTAATEMTTAQARNAAQEAADRLDWAEAARLMDYAVANYPLMPGKKTHAEWAKLDMSKMQARAASWRLAA